MPETLIELGHDTMGFSAAHFVYLGGPCEALHGHNYRVQLVVEGGLDEKGMVVDFGFLKSFVRELCRRLDHKTLLPLLSQHIEVENMGEEVLVKAPGKRYIFPTIETNLLPVSSTTAENLAAYMGTEIATHLDSYGNPLLTRLKVTVLEKREQSGTFIIDLDGTTTDLPSTSVHSLVTSGQ